MPGVPAVLEAAAARLAHGGQARNASQAKCYISDI